MRISAGIFWLALSGAAFITVDAAGKNVKVSFKLKKEQFTEALRDQHSNEYKTMEQYVNDTIKPALIGNPDISDIQVEFFTKGSTDLVIVNSLVSTNEKNQRRANKLVEAALKNITSEVEPSSVIVGVRLCVPALGQCDILQDYIDTTKLPLICIEARDRYNCLQMLNNEDVDLVHGNAADLYLAHDLYPNQFRVVAETRDKAHTYQYKAVAVVRRSTINGLEDLKGSKSCHTGYGKTSGWYVPISKLIKKGEMTPKCEGTASVVEKDLGTVASFFDEACIPGKWAPIDEINTRLKTTYDNLCKLCKDPTNCGNNDEYAGYEGALKCLINSSADVAWTKLDEVDKFFNSNSHVNKSDFGFLCYNGSIVDIDTPGGCYWAAKPWSAWLTWTSRPKEGNKIGVVRTLERLVGDLQSHWLIWGTWAEDVLEIYNNSIIEKIKPRIPPYNYLIQADYYTTISQVVCPTASPLRLCVVGAEAEQKCQELGEVLISRRVQPNLACVKKENEHECLEAIASDNADMITLDGGDVFEAYSVYGFIPVISEVHGKSHVSYYAVAVVKDGSHINSLAALQGKKSCHTGIEKSAGWKVPVMRLLEANLLNESKCDYAKQMGHFFSESCAPGANSSKYDCDGTNPASLCSLCVGNKDGDYKCARNDSERFYGYSGAFRCLEENVGDVAFIKHTTVPGNANLTFDDGEYHWNQNLDARNYKLLCLNGTHQEWTAYESCHWASVPSHKVVTRNETNGVLQENVRILLLRASETLPLGQNDFTMFGVYDGHRDIIFKSSATSLANFDEDDFIQLREGGYWQALIKLEKCECPP